MFVQLLQTAIGLSADSLLTAEWERILAEAYFRMGNVEQSLEHYHRTLDLLGAPYPMPERHTLLKPALHYLQHRFTPMFSVSQSATPSQNLTLALTYEKMGMIYYIKNDTARTLSSCLHGYNRARESKNGEAIAYTSVNLSFAWIALRSPNQAKHHIKQALNAIEPYNSRCLRTRINGRRTVYYNSIGDWGKGEKLSQFAINEFEKLELWREYGEQQTIFCMNLYLQGKYEQIIEQIEALKAVYQYDKSDQLLSGLLAQTYGYIRLEQWDQVEELVNELGQSFDSVRFTGTMEPIYHTVMSLWWTHQQAHEQALYHIQQVDELLQSRTHSFAMFPCFEGAIEACEQIRTDSTNPQISQEALELMEQLLRSLKTFCGTYQFAAEHYACYATETTSSNSASSATA